MLEARAENMHLQFERVEGNETVRGFGSCFAITKNKILTAKTAK